MSDDNLKDVYDKLCASYQGIDTFRAQLLGLLPLTTGSGIFLLYSNLTAEAKEFLGPIGLFGFAITEDLPYVSPRFSRTDASCLPSLAR